MKINYIYHSGFTFQYKDYLLIFDYYRGDLKLDENKKNIFFVSHSHEDHYNEEIFEMPGDYYILSSDLNKEESNKFIIMKAYEERKLMDLKITSLGSTDKGISFLIEIDDLTIFHSGDLNWWYWPEDSPEEKLEMEKDFKHEIERLKDYKIDFAFFPVDPRLGENFFLGAGYFIDQLRPRYLIPMHFGDRLGETMELIHKLPRNNTHILPIEREGQTIYHNRT